MSTSRFIEDRLRNIESELNTVESNITDYQSRHAIVDMDAVSSMYLSPVSYTHLTLPTTSRV